MGAYLAMILKGAVVQGMGDKMACRCISQKGIGNACKRWNV